MLEIGGLFESRDDCVGFICDVAELAEFGDALVLFGEPLQEMLVVARPNHWRSWAQWRAVLSRRVFEGGEAFYDGRRFLWRHAQW